MKPLLAVLSRGIICLTLNYKTELGIFPDFWTWPILRVWKLWRQYKPVLLFALPDSVWQSHVSYQSSTKNTSSYIGIAASLAEEAYGPPGSNSTPVKQEQSFSSLWLNVQNLAGIQEFENYSCHSELLFTAHFVPKSLVDEVEGDIWSRRKIQICWLATLTA